MKSAIGLAAVAALATSAALAETVAPTNVALVDGVVEASLTGQPGDPDGGATKHHSGARQGDGRHRHTQSRVSRRDA